MVGFSGPDCSQRECEYGPDPRLSQNVYEVCILSKHLLYLHFYSHLSPPTLPPPNLEHHCKLCMCVCLHIQTITLVCDCDPDCNGKFKLSFMGQPIRRWLSTQSTADDLKSALLNTPGT
ncbi:hypothetical protein EON65_05565 [archaeon]|nr:MAG: hypothetical protein EON65_05565 [archaeon]